MCRLEQEIAASCPQFVSVKKGGVFTILITSIVEVLPGRYSVSKRLLSQLLSVVCMCTWFCIDLDHSVRKIRCCILGYIHVQEAVSLHCVSTQV